MCTLPLQSLGSGTTSFAVKSSRGRQEKDYSAALTEVEAVYADLEQTVEARMCGNLTECCQFKLTGLTPYLTKGEALLIVKALRASGRTKLPEVPEGICPFLDQRTGKCLVYSARPFGCRTHFCKAAGGPYPRKPLLPLIRRLEEVDAQLKGRGPQMLPAAVRQALTGI